MAECTWTSHLKSIAVTGSHTFIIDNFLSKVRNVIDSSQTERFTSASFLAQSSQEDFDAKLQVVVKVELLAKSNYVRVVVFALLPECPLQVPSPPKVGREFQDYARDYQTNAPEPVIPVTSQFNFLDEQYNVIYKSKPLHGYYNGHGVPIDSFLSVSAHQVLEEPSQYLRSDHSLAIQCSIELNCGTDLAMESTAPINPDLKLSVRLTPEKYPDMYLVSGKTRLPCHKHMLAACSNVFDVMFTHDSSEKETNEVIITDVQLKTLEKLLEFVYTDEIKDFEGLAHSLVYVADKYNMANLKTLAMNAAVRNLDTNNVSDYFALGELVQSEYLVQRASDFAFKNATKVMKSDGWKALSHESLRKLFVSISKSRLA
ncbi:hypothetical protein TCAL_09507 [Tigriopus californicus]|uniref:BTB domain-containing protein n=1 Tax=Tigriopus californicus TaxID=6832 RepID=A0A553PCP8_TIGCA|nr:speckle-type POZ protein-like [Tigriopus californicus]TRY75438.1 hypothetical protein TCAL_09507 [Tigriopus californicus]|eukprot:TCALIF_09507-PA protein Name:"Similar to rdx Protein roadkill (Drosophila melanogaster)" AED:0.30 eAED:0.31 QI:0/-1/0/1/-1/1/1/0/371